MVVVVCVVLWVAPSDVVTGTIVVFVVSAVVVSAGVVVVVVVVVVAGVISVAATFVLSLRFSSLREQDETPITHMPTKVAIRIFLRIKTFPFE